MNRSHQFVYSKLCNTHVSAFPQPFTAGLWEGFHIEHTYFLLGKNTVVSLTLQKFVGQYVLPNCSFKRYVLGENHIRVYSTAQDM